MLWPRCSAHLHVLKALERNAEGDAEAEQVHRLAEDLQAPAASGSFRVSAPQRG